MKKQTQAVAGEKEHRFFSLSVPLSLSFSLFLCLSPPLRLHKHLLLALLLCQGPLQHSQGLHLAVDRRDIDGRLSR